MVKIGERMNEHACFVFNMRGTIAKEEKNFVFHISVIRFVAYSSLKSTFNQNSSSEWLEQIIIIIIISFNNTNRV